jgi:hypothetical protein
MSTLVISVCFICKATKAVCSADQKQVPICCLNYVKI